MKKTGIKCVTCGEYVTLDYCYDYDLCLECGPMRPKDKVNVEAKFYSQLRKKTDA